MPLDPRHFLPGERVPDTSWVVVEKLGEGGTGVVLKVTRPPGLVMAMKVILPHLAARRDCVEDFLREVRLQATLGHRHIVRVTELEALPIGLLYATMECIDGCTLRQAMRALGKPVQPPQVYEITRQICEGLERAHADGVVHRDLKPENVFLDAPDGVEATVKVGDFGLAALGTDARAAGIYGTPRYMAPEQFRGEPPTARTDIYALGAMVFEMLTGQLPLAIPPGAGLDVAQQFHLWTRPRDIREYAPYLPAAVAEALLASQEKHPANRPGDVLELCKGLIELQFAGEATSIDENAATQMSIATLAGLVPPRSRRSDVQPARSTEPRARSGDATSAQTSFGMATPTMDGRSLELAPFATVPPAPKTQRTLDRPPLPAPAVALRDDKSETTQAPASDVPHVFASRPARSSRPASALLPRPSASPGTPPAPLVPERRPLLYYVVIAASVLAALTFLAVLAWRLASR